MKSGRKRDPNRHLKECGVPNCKNRQFGHGYCKAHYNKYCTLNRNLTGSFMGMYLARFLDKQTINYQEYLRFMLLKAKKDKKILRLIHERSIVEKILLKYNGFTRKSPKVY